MNKLVISGTVFWATDKKNVDKAIDELFEAIVKSGLELDIDITYGARLEDENGEEIEED